MTKKFIAKNIKLIISKEEMELKELEIDTIPMLVKEEDIKGGCGKNTLLV